MFSLVFPLPSTWSLAKTEAMGEETSMGVGETGEWIVWSSKVAKHSLRKSGSRLRVALKATGKRKISNEAKGLTQKSVVSCSKRKGRDDVAGRRQDSWIRGKRKKSC